ncbi:helix-turn-helix domain-containing protein [Botrimarina sp.]|uniref:helix-turn-helix domain-containing protein n=1 Tax=Botrimarina sp. TaxID=2795802 RepID=UPI0032EFB65E
MLEREGFVTVKQAAKLLDVAPNTVRAWGAAGSISEYRHPVNNYRLYKRNELEELIRMVHQSVRATRNKKPR